jgi:hypothetical protein
MKIKAFVDMTSAATIREGIIQLMRLSGLGILMKMSIFILKYFSYRWSSSEYGYSGLL